MANKCMKKCSMSLNRNMQIKTTLGYCLTGIRMSTTKTPPKKVTKAVFREVEKLEPLCTAGGNANAAATMGPVGHSLRILEMESA